MYHYTTEHYVLELKKGFKMKSVFVMLGMKYIENEELLSVDNIIALDTNRLNF